MPNLDMLRKGHLNTLSYDVPDHEVIPHIVKFSGGRSSGMLLLQLLESGQLRSERGDAVVFCNTSAEHPLTYDFVYQMKLWTESLGIPFFIIEFRTYETVVRGMWQRRPSYRLASIHQGEEFRKHKDQYASGGEVFEEMIAYHNILPNIHQRICTSMLKLFTTHEFLSDWLAKLQKIPFQGHRDASRICIDEAYREYCLAGGRMSEMEFNVRHKYLANSSRYRPEQSFADYSHTYNFQENCSVQGHSDNSIKDDLHSKSETNGHLPNIRCNLFGVPPVPFLTFIGFRADEPRRYARLMQNNNSVNDNILRKTRAPGEFSYAPLFKHGINKDDVAKFWKRFPPSLAPKFPSGVSNCVHCFLKSPQVSELLEQQHQNDKEVKPRHGPASLIWWAKVEEKYQRIAKSGGKFGFRGKDGLSYREIKNRVSKKSRIFMKRKEDFALVQNGLADLPCECTD